MCGIVGYISNREAADILLKGLKRLEYRGYDSAGIALSNGAISIYKKDGKVAQLEDCVKNKTTKASIVGHTRWATHGHPSQQNAHPHQSMCGNFVMVHNGIIENYETFKNELVTQGYQITGETDSEVLVNYIEHIYLTRNIDVEEAVKQALQKVIGSYAIAVLSKTETDKIIVARKSSPLVVGIGEQEYFIASDAIPIVRYTKEVVYLNDDEIVVIQKDNLKLKNLASEAVEIKKTKIDLEVEKLEKDGYDYFMMKEIFEQPQTIADTFNRHMNAEKTDILLSNFAKVLPGMAKGNRIVIIACGYDW